MGRWWSWQRRHHAITLLLAVVIGVTSGYTALVFRIGIEWISGLFYGHMDETTFISYVSALPWWHRLAAPIGGGLLICLMLRFLTTDYRAHSIPDVIESTHLKNGRFKARDVGSSFLISMCTLGSGGSAGREGPVVHACSGLASLITDRLHLSADIRLTMIGCAAAAGVAASFNTPLAGVIFALEVVVGSYALRSFAPVVVASVCGTMVTRAHIGNYPAFILPTYTDMNLLELPAFALLGITCALSAVLFMRAITTADDIANKTNVPFYYRPFFGGILLGLIAIPLPEVLGVGYEATSNALLEQYTFSTLMLLIAAKTVATSVTLGTRFGGGIVSGSLYVGAMTGGAFGIVAASAFPEAATSYGFYALVGMAAVTGAVMGAPISTVFMVFELTHNTNATIAIMLATAISSLFVTAFHGRSFFFLALERRGIKISGGRVRQLMSEIHVSDVMSHDLLTASEETPLKDLHHTLQHHPGDEAFLLDSDYRISGRVNLSDFRDVDFAAGDGEGVLARQIARPARSLLAQGDTLDTALEILDASAEDLLPVVENRANRVPKGFVTHKKVLLAYNRALLDARAYEQGEEDFDADTEADVGSSSDSAKQKPAAS